MKKNLKEKAEVKALMMALVTTLVKEAMPRTNAATAFWRLTSQTCLKLKVLPTRMRPGN